MGRAPCCDKANVKRGPWSPEEDAKLKDYIEKHGTGGNWIALPQKAGLRRCGKSCRLRWLNYLRPDIKHGEFSDDEDRIICTLYANIGSRWSIIAAQLPGRTDNDIKNYWNTKLKKKLMMMGSYYNSINPLTNYPSYGISPSIPEQNHHHQYNLFSPAIPTQSVPSTSSSELYEPSPFNNSSSSSPAATTLPTQDHPALVGPSNVYDGILGVDRDIVNYGNATPLPDYYGIEEIKQLISNNSSSTMFPNNINYNNCNYGSFLFEGDESKGGIGNLPTRAEEGFLHYY